VTSAPRHAAWLTGAALLIAATQCGAEPPAPATPRVHVVVPGDTLSRIAARYKVTMTALAAANHLGERAMLKVGGRLVIPGTAPRAATERRGAPTRRPPTNAQGLELAVPDFVETSPAFGWPVEGPISSLFGRRRNSWHRGIDIKADPGTVVFAAAAGTVVTNGVEPRYGRVVKIEHGDGYLTVYAHNEENLVEVGATVTSGDPIATVGRSGRATAHHLHFEIRRNGGVYNPLYLLPLPPRVARVEESDELDDDHE
jgi:murein DD-endopeptidase MepM/ murein hydrolase activator NlpD